MHSFYYVKIKFAYVSSSRAIYIYVQEVPTHTRIILYIYILYIYALWTVAGDLSRVIRVGQKDICIS